MGREDRPPLSPQGWGVGSKPLCTAVWKQSKPLRQSPANLSKPHKSSNHTNVGCNRAWSAGLALSVPGGLRPASQLIRAPENHGKSLSRPLSLEPPDGLEWGLDSSGSQAQWASTQLQSPRGPRLAPVTTGAPRIVTGNRMREQESEGFGLRGGNAICSLNRVRGSTRPPPLYFRALSSSSPFLSSLSTQHPYAGVTQSPPTSASRPPVYF